MSTTTEAEEPAAVREAPATASTQSTTADEKRPAPLKTAFYQDRAAAARMRATYLHTLAQQLIDQLDPVIDAARTVIARAPRPESSRPDPLKWRSVEATVRAAIRVREVPDSDARVKMHSCPC